MGNKDELYNRIMLKVLMENDVITISKLAKLMQVSEKTARNKVDQVNQWLKKEDLGFIKKTPGLGISLITEKASDILTSDISVKSGDTDLSRQNQLIGILLKYAVDQPATLQLLADHLYISPPTAASLLKMVTPWFEKRKLHVISMRSKGIQLQGTERAYRQALVDYIVYTMTEITDTLFETYLSGVDYAKVKSIIIHAESSWRLQFAENSFRTAWLMVCLSIKRFRHPLQMVDSSDKGETLTRYSEYLFAKSIYDRVSSEFSLGNCENDILFLTFVLLSAQKIGNNGLTDIRTNPSYFNRQLNQGVNDIISIIGAVLNENFSEDTILYEGLLMHIRSAVFRLRYGEENINQISQYIKKEYKQVYLAAWSISPVFEKYYNVQITEEEIVNIALYIQSAVIRKNTPLTGLLVSNFGMGSSQLMVDLLLKNIPELDNIKVISEHDFRENMCRQYDVIFSTKELKNCSRGQVIRIGEVLSDRDIFAVKERVKQIRRIGQNTCFHSSSICHDLFRVGYMLVHPKVNGKEDLLAKMVSRLAEKGDVTEEYLGNVLKRENATTTAIGGGVAIPHGNNMAVNESRVVVAILDQPIMWHEEQVDIIFLLALKMDTILERAKAQQFYKDFIHLTENEAFLNQLRHIQSELDLYQYFIK